MGNAVIGTGRYLPERVVTNQEIQDSGVDYDPARCGGLSLAQWGHTSILAEPCATGLRRAKASPT